LLLIHHREQARSYKGPAYFPQRVLDKGVTPCW
jgi:hypothetical protein